MQSSFNLIKGKMVQSAETTTIETEYIPTAKQENGQEITEEDAKKYISSYEKIGQGIIEEAKREKEKYMLETIEKANELEKEAYNKGYKQGLENGREDGKKEAYQTYVPKAQEDAEKLAENATNLLKEAKKEYDNYIDSKKKEIIDMILNVSSKVLNREIQMNPNIQSMIEQALILSKGEKNVIIKCNTIHVIDLKNKIEEWKPVYNITGEIFVLADDNMVPGNAVIEKDSGRIEVGIEIGMEKIRESLT